MSQIPRIIHQTWKNDQIPEHWKESHENWKKFHPDWEYKLWTDEACREYIEERHPDFLSTYDSFPHKIQRIDAVRPFWMKDFGGVYSDLDLAPQEPIDKYLSNDCDVYLVESANTGHYTNMFMISKPGVPLWDTYIEEMKKPKPYWAVTKHFEVMTTTGPLALDRVARNYKGVVGHLPKVLFNPTGLKDDLCLQTDSVIKVLPGSSWHSWDSTVIVFIFKHSTLLICLVVLIAILIIVLLVYYCYKYNRVSNTLKRIRTECYSVCEAAFTIKT